jgi:hypothetical protein
MVTAARRHRDRAKFAAPPIVHILACSRGSVRGVCFALINEEKRSLPNQHKQPHPTAITTCSLTVEFRPRDGKQKRCLTPSHLLSHTKARRRWPDTPRRPYRQPAADDALDPCSATKTSSCSERNASSSSRNTRTAAAGAARPGIDRHQVRTSPRSFVLVTGWVWSREPLSPGLHRHELKIASTRAAARAASSIVRHNSLSTSQPRHGGRLTETRNTLARSSITCSKDASGLIPSRPRRMEKTAPMLLMRWVVAVHKDVHR